MQLSRTYAIARDRLAELQRQRAELDTVIEELKGQLVWGEEIMASMRQTAAA
jgi:uncharacterized coiled-coil protein SlyX